MKKSKQEILSIVSKEIHNASGYIGGELVARRKKSLEYYLGMPLGNEMITNYIRNNFKGMPLTPDSPH